MTKIDGLYLIEIELWNAVIPFWNRCFSLQIASNSPFFIENAYFCKLFMRFNRL